MTHQQAVPNQSVAIGVGRERNDDIIHSLARGIELLRAFGPDNDRMTIAQAAKAARLTRAGARRILLTLENLGYVSCDGRWYWLTARVLELGQGYLAQPLWGVVRPTLLSVARTLNETVSAGVLDGHDVVYTVRTRSSRMLQLELRPGARLPAYPLSLGRVLLAALPRAALERYIAQVKFVQFTKCDPAALRARLEQVRKQGWCHVHDELEGGVAGVAVPLLDPAGRTVAALNVSINSDRTRLREVKSTILPLLLEAAASIRKELAALQDESDAPIVPGTKLGSMVQPSLMSTWR